METTHVAAMSKMLAMGSCSYIQAMSQYFSPGRMLTAAESVNLESPGVRLRKKPAEVVQRVGSKRSASYFAAS
jgi:hypothetical protein